MVIIRSAIVPLTSLIETLRYSPSMRNLLSAILRNDFVGSYVAHWPSGNTPTIHPFGCWKSSEKAELFADALPYPW